MHVRDLRDCSGPWKGFWIQDLIRGHMRLTLQFSGSDVNGRGNDAKGEFQVSGIFSDVNGGVLFTTTYQTHAVEYAGTWDGNFIYGKWTLHDEQFTEIGEFEIWPEKEEEMAGVGTATISESLGMPSY
jgi:hypothetical protein